MSLTIRREQTGDVAILQCAGRVVRGRPLHFLKDAVTSLKNPRMVVLDLTDVEMLDGGGLGMLVFLHRWTRDNGIQLKLVNPSAFVREMLDRTRLSCLFDVSSIDDVFDILCTPANVTMSANRAVA
ncbi:MAG TPA: STAS domain-containing protein [Terriglobales bacterium]|nr:STAS domain-containing protein [Terriglobales bacterium]